MLGVHVFYWSFISCAFNIKNMVSQISKKLASKNNAKPILIKKLLRKELKSLGYCYLEAAFRHRA